MNWRFLAWRTVLIYVINVFGFLCCVVIAFDYWHKVHDCERIQGEMQRGLCIKDGKVVL